MCRIFLSLFLVTCLCITAQAQEKKLIDKVTGTVGAEIILLSDIESQLAYMQAQRGAIPPNARCMILENLLGQNLLLHQARVDSIQITDDEVEAQISARVDRILALMNNDYQQFEDYYGKTVSEIRGEFREPIQNQILIERMQNKVLSSITITPAEVRSFFERVPTDSLPYFNSEVEMAEIVYYPKVNDEQKQKAYLQISRMKKMITEEKKDFAEVASEYSDDVGSARLGGDLGWQKRGTFVPEFESVAYNLEPGEISDIFETPFGYHVVQLLERRGNLLHTRHILIIPKIEQVDLDLAIHVLDSLRTAISVDSLLTFEEAVKAYSDENTTSFNNGGRMLNPKSGNTFFEIGDLDHHLFFVIDTLKVGQISSPIAAKDPTGKVSFQMIKLLSRSRPHKASLKTDYSRIREAALAEKKNAHLDKWIESHIARTYIEVDPTYHTCPSMDRWITSSDPKP
ncbi:MAG: peptidylprolyl isomerase [Saprospiraceae bacterium]|nr:peptidylprolyl isomerase [Saprospiraceae bacterium]